MIEAPSGLLDVAHDHVGDSLRSLTSYTEREYELHYIREDIRDRYTEEEIGRVFDDLVLSGLSRDYLEEIFHAGRIECTIYGFEEAAMFHFVTNETSGVFLSFDRDTEVNLDSFIGDCKEHLARDPNADEFEEGDGG